VAGGDQPPGQQLTVTVAETGADGTDEGQAMVAAHPQQ
jgi:hypothetical protein